MENEAIKILEEKRKTLQQMIDAKVGEAFDEGELFQAELKRKLSEIETALNLISSKPFVIKSVCPSCGSNEISRGRKWYWCDECGKMLGQTVL